MSKELLENACRKLLMEKYGDKIKETSKIYINLENEWDGCYCDDSCGHSTAFIEICCDIYSIKYYDFNLDDFLINLMNTK